MAAVRKKYAGTVVSVPNFAPTGAYSARAAERMEHAPTAMINSVSNVPRGPKFAPCAPGHTVQSQNVWIKQPRVKHVRKRSAMNAKSWNTVIFVILTFVPSTIALLIVEHVRKSIVEPAALIRVNYVVLNVTKPAFVRTVIRRPSVRSSRSKCY